MNLKKKVEQFPETKVEFVFAVDQLVKREAATSQSIGKWNVGIDELRQAGYMRLVQMIDNFGQRLKEPKGETF